MKNKIISKGYIEYFAFLIISMFLLIRPIGDMDEIWNYNFGYNICNGLVPYSDFNCILTPLSAYISGLFLSLFGNNLLSFRLLGIFLLASTFYILYRILWKCGNNKVLAFTCSSFAFVLCYLIWNYNYNNLNLLLILLVLLLEYSIDKNEQPGSILFYILVGFTYSLIFLSKQSVGALLLIYNFGYCLIFFFLNKQCRINYILRFVSSLVFPVIFVLCLIMTGVFGDFWDYAVAGIGTFSLRITYWEFITSSVINFLLGVTPLIITFFSVITIIKRTSKVSIRFHIVSLIVSWLSFAVAYPLCDYIHMSIGIVPFIICVFCCFDATKMKKSEKYICIFISCVILISMGVSEINTMDMYKKCDLKNFEGLLIERELEDHIIEVNQFIKSKENEGLEVLIVDSYAAAYLLPLDKYYKDFSLLNQGNLGTKTVSDLLWRDNAIYLVNSNLSTLNRQSHFELIEYIVNNYKKIGEVSGFDIFEKR